MPFSASIASPPIAVTLGDAAGIGPETILKALPGVPGVVVIGGGQVLSDLAYQLGLKVDLRYLNEPEDLPQTNDSAIYVLDRFELDKKNFVMGQPHQGAGELAFCCIVEAVKLAQAGRVKALVTAPICKESLHLAGHPFDGHTGLLAELTGTKDYRMTFSTKELRIIHVTAHMALAEACKKITQERVFSTIQIGRNHLIALGIENHRIDVCGLNPHAGEAGIFGREEIEIINPALAQAQALGWDCKGPIPGDVVFIQGFKGQYDLIVAMYHDQGHIPGKLVAFDRGVNVTVGLPFVRCSPDHGTAFDIAGKGLAKEGNLLEALAYARLLLR